MPVPNVYEGWVQKLPKSFCDKLTKKQRHSIGTPIEQGLDETETPQ